MLQPAAVAMGLLLSLGCVCADTTPAVVFDLEPGAAPTASSAAYCGGFLVVGRAPLLTLAAYHKTAGGWTQCGAVSSGAEMFGAKVQCLAGCEGGGARMAATSAAGVHTVAISADCVLTEVAFTAFRTAAPVTAFSAYEGAFATAHLDGHIERSLYSDVCSGTANTTDEMRQLSADSVAMVAGHVAAQSGEETVLEEVAGGVTSTRLGMSCEGLDHLLGVGLTCVDGAATWSLCGLSSGMHAASVSTSTSSDSKDVTVTYTAKGAELRTAKIGDDVLFTDGQTLATLTPLSSPNPPAVACSTEHGGVVVVRGQVFLVFPPAQHGGLSEFSPFGACSNACGSGTMSRTRTCSNPTPMYGGNTCATADETETVACTSLPADWHITAGNCTCSGTQTQAATCLLCDGTVSTLCSEADRPPTEVACTPQTIDWLPVGEFSECTTSVQKKCGVEGVQTRSVQCGDVCTLAVTGLDECSPETQPRAVQACVGEWHEWTATEVCLEAPGATSPSSCEGVSQMVCRAACSGLTVGETHCAGLEKPELPCQRRVFGVTHTKYGICDNICGAGSQYRQAFCVDTCETTLPKTPFNLAQCGTSEAELTLRRDCTFFEGGYKADRPGTCRPTCVGRAGTQTMGCTRQCDSVPVASSFCGGASTRPCTMPANCPPINIGPTINTNGCYPRTAELLTRNGPKAAADVTSADELRTCTAQGVCTWSTMHGVHHHSHATPIDMTRLRHGAGLLVVSPDHFVYTTDGRKRAQEVALGDVLLVHEGEGEGEVLVASPVTDIGAETVDGFVSHLTPTSTLLIRSDAKGAWTLISEHSSYDFSAEVMDLVYLPFHFLTTFTGDIDSPQEAGLDHLHWWANGLLWCASSFGGGETDLRAAPRAPTAWEGLVVLGVFALYIVLHAAVVVCGLQVLFTATTKPAKTTATTTHSSNHMWLAALVCVLCTGATSVSGAEVTHRDHPLHSEVDYRMRIKSKTEVKHHSATTVSGGVRWADFDLTAVGASCHAVHVRSLFEGVAGSMPQQVDTAVLNKCLLHVCDEDSPAGPAFRRHSAECTAPEALEVMLMLRPLTMWYSFGNGTAKEEMQHAQGKVSQHSHTLSGTHDAHGLKTVEICTDATTHEDHGHGMVSRTCATLSRERATPATAARTAAATSTLLTRVTLTEAASKAQIHTHAHRSAAEPEEDSLAPRVRHLVTGMSDSLEAVHALMELMTHRWEEVVVVIEEEEYLSRVEHEHEDEHKQQHARHMRRVLDALALAGTVEATARLEQCVVVRCADVNVLSAVVWQGMAAHAEGEGVPSLSRALLSAVEEHASTAAGTTTTTLEEPHLVGAVIAKHSAAADQQAHADTLLAVLKGPHRAGVDVLRSLPMHTVRDHAAQFADAQCSSGGLGCGAALRVLSRDTKNAVVRDTLAHHAVTHPHPDARATALSLLHKRHDFGCREAGMLAGNVTTTTATTRRGHVDEAEKKLVRLLAGARCGRTADVQESLLSFDKTFGLPLKLTEKKLGGGPIVVTMGFEYGVFAKLAADILGGFFEFEAKAVAHAFAELEVLGFTFTIFDADFRLGKFLSLSAPPLGEVIDVITALTEGDERESNVLAAKKKSGFETPSKTETLTEAQICAQLKTRGFEISSSCSSVKATTKDYVQAVKLFKAIVQGKRSVEEQSSTLSPKLQGFLKKSSKAMWQRASGADCLDLASGARETHLRSEAQDVVEGIAQQLCDFWRARGSGSLPRIGAASPPQGGSYPSEAKPLHGTAHRTGSDLTIEGIPRSYQAKGGAKPSVAEAMFHAEAAFWLTRDSAVSYVTYAPWEQTCMMVHILNFAQSEGGVEAGELDEEAVETFFTHNFELAAVVAHESARSACAAFGDVSAYRTFERSARGEDGNWAAKVRYADGATADHYTLVLDFGKSVGIDLPFEVTQETLNRLSFEFAGQSIIDRPVISAHEASALAELSVTNDIPGKRILLARVQTCILVVFFCLELSAEATLEIGATWSVGLNLPEKQLTAGLGPNVRLLVTAQASISLVIAKVGVEIRGVVMDVTIPVTAGVDFSSFPLATSLSVPLELVPFAIEVNAFVAYIQVKIGFFYVRVSFKTHRFTILRFSAKSRQLMLFKREFPTATPEAPRAMPQVALGSSATFVEGGASSAMRTKQWPGSNTPVTKYCGRMLGADGSACGATTCSTVPTLDVPTVGCSDGWVTVEMSAEGSTGRAATQAGRQMYVVQGPPVPVLDTTADVPKDADGCQYRTDAALLCVRWTESRFSANTTVAVTNSSGDVVASASGQLGRRFCIRDVARELPDGEAYNMTVTTVGVTGLSSEDSMCVRTDFRVPQVTEATATCGDDVTFQTDLRRLCFSARVGNVPFGGLEAEPVFFVKLANGSLITGRGVLTPIAGGGEMRFTASVVVEDTAADLPVGRNYAEATVKGKAGSSARVPLGSFFTFATQAPERVANPACVLPSGQVCVTLTEPEDFGFGPTRTLSMRLFDGETAVEAALASTSEAVTFDAQQCFSMPASHAEVGLRVGVAATQMGQASAFTLGNVVRVTALAPECGVYVGDATGRREVSRFASKVCFIATAEGCGVHGAQATLSDAFGATLATGPAVLGALHCLPVDAATPLDDGAEYTLAFTATGGNLKTCLTSHRFTVDLTPPANNVTHPVVVHAGNEVTVSVERVSDDTATETLTASLGEELLSVTSVQDAANKTVFTLETGNFSGNVQFFYAATDAAGNVQRESGRIVVWTPPELSAGDVVNGRYAHDAVVPQDRLTVTLLPCVRRADATTTALGDKVVVTGVYGATTVLTRAAAEEAMRRCSDSGHRLVRTSAATAVEVMCEGGRVLLAVISANTTTTTTTTVTATAARRMCQDTAWGLPPVSGRGRIIGDTGYCSALVRSLPLREVLFTSPGHSDVQTVGNCIGGRTLDAVLSGDAEETRCGTGRFGGVRGHPAVDADVLTFGGAGMVVRATDAAGLGVDGTMSGLAVVGGGAVHNTYLAVWGVPQAVVDHDGTCPIPSRFEELQYACSLAVLDAENTSVVYHTGALLAGQHSVTVNLTDSASDGTSVVSRVTCSDGTGTYVSATSPPSVLNSQCSGEVAFTQRAYPDVASLAATVDIPAYDCVSSGGCTLEYCLGTAPFDCSVVATTQTQFAETLDFSNVTNVTQLSEDTQVFLLVRVLKDGLPTCELPVATADVDTTPPKAAVYVDCGCGASRGYACSEDENVTCTVFVSGDEPSSDAVDITLTIDGGAEVLFSQVGVAVVREGFFAKTYFARVTTSHAQKLTVTAFVENGAGLSAKVSQSKIVDTTPAALSVAVNDVAMTDFISDEDVPVMLVNAFAPNGWCVEWNATHDLGDVTLRARVEDAAGAALPLPGTTGAAPEGTNTTTLCFGNESRGNGGDGDVWVGLVSLRVVSGQERTTRYRVTPDSVHPAVLVAVAGLPAEGAANSSDLCVDTTATDDHSVRSAELTVRQQGSVIVETAAVATNAQSQHCLKPLADGLYVVTLTAVDMVGLVSSVEQVVRVATAIPAFAVELGCEEGRAILEDGKTLWAHATLCVSHETHDWVTYATEVEDADGKALPAGFTAWENAVQYTVRVVATDNYGFGLTFTSDVVSFVFAEGRTEVVHALNFTAGSSYESVHHVSAGEVCVDVSGLAPASGETLSCGVVVTPDVACEPQNADQTAAQCAGAVTTTFAAKNDTLLDVVCVALRKNDNVTDSENATVTATLPEGTLQAVAQCRGPRLSGEVAAGLLVNEVTRPLLLGVKTYDVTPDVAGQMVRVAINTVYPGSLDVTVQNSAGETFAEERNIAVDTEGTKEGAADGTRSFVAEFAEPFESGVYKVVAQFRTHGGFAVLGETSFQSVPVDHVPVIEVLSNDTENEKTVLADALSHAHAPTVRNGVLLVDTVTDESLDANYTITYLTQKDNIVRFRISSEFAVRSVGFSAGRAGPGSDVVAVTWLPLSEEGVYEAELTTVVLGEVFLTAHVCLTECSTALLGVFQYDLTAPVKVEAEGLPVPVYAAPSLGQTVYFNTTFEDDETDLSRFVICIAASAEAAEGGACTVRLDTEIPQYEMLLPATFPAGPAVTCITAHNKAGLTTQVCNTTTVSLDSPDVVARFGFGSAPLQGRVKPGLGVTLSSGLEEDTAVPLLHCRFTLTVNDGLADESEKIEATMFPFPLEVAGGDVLGAEVCCTLANQVSACSTATSVVLSDAEVSALLSEGNTLADFGSVDVTPPVCKDNFTQMCSEVDGEEDCSSERVFVTVGRNATASWGGCADAESEMLYNCTLSVLNDDGSTTIAEVVTTSEAGSISFEKKATPSTRITCTAANRFGLNVTTSAEAVWDFAPPTINTRSYSQGCIHLALEDTISGVDVSTLSMQVGEEDWTSRYNGSHVCWTTDEVENSTMLVKVSDFARNEASALVALRGPTSTETTFHSIGLCSGNTPTLCPARMPETNEVHSVQFVVDGTATPKVDFDGCMESRFFATLYEKHGVSHGSDIQMRWTKVDSDVLVTEYSCVSAPTVRSVHKKDNEDNVVMIVLLVVAVVVLLLVVLGLMVYTKKQDKNTTAPVGSTEPCQHDEHV